MSFNLMVQPREISILLPWDRGIFLPTETISAGRIEDALRDHTSILDAAPAHQIAGDLYEVITWTLNARVRAGLTDDTDRERISVFTTSNIIDITFNTTLDPLPGSLLLNIRKGDADQESRVNAYRVSGNEHTHRTDPSPLGAGEDFTDRLVSAGLGDWAGFLDGLDDILITLGRVHDSLHATVCV